jgi:exonuclease VII large subunit
MSKSLRSINRSLSPLERKYKKSIARLDKHEKSLRKRFGKKIEKAKVASKQKSLRVQRDKKIEKLRVQRKRLKPLRDNIVKWQAKARSFEGIRF